MNNLNQEIHLATEICEYLSAQGWHYAVGDVVAYEQAWALCSATVTGKIDVSGMVNNAPESEAVNAG